MFDPIDILQLIKRPPYINTISNFRCSSQVWTEPF